MPSDPAALLELAAKTNGLQNAGTEPLHIKATYELLDAKGVVKETGTFEEFRVSASKFKLTYASPSLNQTDYRTEAGLFRVGGSKWPAGPPGTAHGLLFPTFPSAEWLAKSKLGWADRKVGTTALKCVALDSAGSSPAGHAATYCFDPGAPILRIEERARGANRSLYNGIAYIRGAYIARDAILFRQGNAEVRVHLDLLDAVPQVDEGLFTPPAEAMQVPLGVSAPGVSGGKYIGKVTPEYPQAAKMARVQGTVVIQAIIGKDGGISDLRTISGPPLLLKAALDCVKQWRYEPFQFNGEPVEVFTNIDVEFKLGGS